MECFDTCRCPLEPDLLHQDSRDCRAEEIAKVKGEDPHAWMDKSKKCAQLTSFSLNSEKSAFRNRALSGRENWENVAWEKKIYIAISLIAENKPIKL